MYSFIVNPNAGNGRGKETWRRVEKRLKRLGTEYEVMFTREPGDARTFAADELRDILEALPEEPKYGVVLRAKGIVEASDGGWLHFDYVPGEPDVRRGSAGVTGRLCVIGSGLNEDALAELFGVARN